MKRLIETASEEARRVLLAKRVPIVTVPKGTRKPVPGADAHKAAHKLLEEMKG